MTYQSGIWYTDYFPKPWIFVDWKYTQPIYKNHKWRFVTLSIDRKPEVSASICLNEWTESCLQSNTFVLRGMWNWLLCQYSITSRGHVLSWYNWICIKLTNRSNGLLHVQKQDGFSLIYLTGVLWLNETTKPTRVPYSLTRLYTFGLIE